MALVLDFSAEDQLKLFELGGDISPGFYSMTVLQLNSDKDSDLKWFQQELNAEKKAFSDLKATSFRGVGEITPFPTNKPRRYFQAVQIEAAGWAESLRVILERIAKKNPDLFDNPHLQSKDAFEKSLSLTYSKYGAKTSAKADFAIRFSRLSLVTPSFPYGCVTTADGKSTHSRQIAEFHVPFIADEKYVFPCACWACTHSKSCCSHHTKCKKTIRDASGGRVTCLDYFRAQHFLPGAAIAQGFRVEQRQAPKPIIFEKKIEEVKVQNAFDFGDEEETSIEDKDSKDTKDVKSEPASKPKTKKSSSSSSSKDEKKKKKEKKTEEKEVKAAPAPETKQPDISEPVAKALEEKGVAEALAIINKEIPDTTAPIPGLASVVGKALSKQKVDKATAKSVVDAFKPLLLRVAAGNADVNIKLLHAVTSTGALPADKVAVLFDQLLQDAVFPTEAFLAWGDERTLDIKNLDKKTQKAVKKSYEDAVFTSVDFLLALENSQTKGSKKKAAKK